MLIPSRNSNHDADSGNLRPRVHPTNPPGGLVICPLFSPPRCLRLTAMEPAVLPIDENEKWPINWPPAHQSHVAVGANSRASQRFGAPATRSSPRCRTGFCGGRRRARAPAALLQRPRPRFHLGCPAGSLFKRRRAAIFTRGREMQCNRRTRCRAGETLQAASVRRPLTQRVGSSAMRLVHTTCTPHCDIAFAGLASTTGGLQTSDPLPTTVRPVPSSKRATGEPQGMCLTLRTEA